MYPPDVIRCPVHNQPDCSPLLNGCTIPSALAQAYDRGKTDAGTSVLDRVTNSVSTALRAVLTDDTHIVNLQPDGFGLRHGFPCRDVGLMNCDVDQALKALKAPPAPPGYYRVTVEDGAVVIGDPVEQTYDSTKTALLDVIAILKDATRA